MAYLGAIVIRFCVIKPLMPPFSVFVDKLSIASGVFAVAGRHGSNSLALALGTPLYMKFLTAQYNGLPPVLSVR